MYIRKHVIGSHMIWLSIVFLLMLVLFNTCDKNPSDLTLGKEFVESQTAITLIDTFSVKLSTVLLDTVITSGTEKMLIGHYRDAIVGEITSDSYFQLGVPENIDANSDDSYDSLNLVIRYSGYSFGDTTQSQKISVYRLTEKIESDAGGSISSNKSYSYDPNPIGSVTYTPRPNSSQDTLAIKINDDIGRALFDKLINNADVVSANEAFLNYFYGLALVADESFDGAIIGFNGAESAARFILYSNRGVSSIEYIRHEFALLDDAKQFNHIHHDFTGTPLATLVDQRTALAGTKTDGAAFLQGGIGLAIRVHFPSLPEILLRERGLIVKAQLAIAPLRNSYHQVALPATLTAYMSDKLNRVNGTVESSSLVVDEFYNEETVYSFDVTDYITYELADSYVNPEDGLIIMLPDADQTSSFGRLIADENAKLTKLKIHYLSY
ncbi:DUF4270 family protein [candidate division KSB1 bacterium]|nr:DUF4270 family protein [candidate division KSB1 bacterium]